MPVQTVASHRTPGGVMVDASGIVLPAGALSTIDARINAMEACVLDLRRAGKVRVPDLDRRCIVVKVVPSAGMSHDGKYELLPATIPRDDQRCARARDEKGLPGKRDCSWRWGLQERADSAGRTALVTPPALYLPELLRAWTDTEYWDVPELARCAGFGLPAGAR